MRSLVVALALVAASSLPVAADSPGPTLGTQAMDGPYPHAFTERCRELSAVGQGSIAMGTCRRVRRFAIAGVQAEIHRLGDDSFAEYYLSMRTAQGWFVSPVPIQIETESGHAGSYDEGTIDAIKLRRVALDHDPGAFMITIAETWRTYCNECDEGPRGHTLPAPRYYETAALVCGVGTGGTPACTSPMYQTGDRPAPPRVVAGKLAIRDSDIGEPTPFGQSWSDLSDGLYAVDL